MKRKTKATVSILLPVHNCEKYLSDCLKSLLSQSFRRLEVIAIDDFSRDNSYKTLLKFKKKDKRLKVYKNVKRYGYAVTLNRLLNKASGQFIGFMNANDLSEKDRIKKQYNFLTKNPQVVVVGTQCRFINEDNKKIGKSKFPKENSIIYQNPLHGISMQFETLLINKQKLPKDLLKFNVNSHPFTYSDLLMKLLPYGKFANLNQYLYYHRRNPKVYFSDLKRNLFPLIKLWVKSTALYNYQPPFISFFSSIIKAS